MNIRITACLAALAGATALTAPAVAADVKIGLIGGISGPIAAMAPAMIEAQKLAIAQVNDGGGILNGDTLVGVVGDSACNPQGGADAAAKAVNIDGVIAMAGPHCSGATLAAANTVTIPAGVTVVSPSATSPEVTALKDNDTVFRTVPSDAYQGAALARTLKGMGYEKIAATYLNNDYGKGLAEAFKAEWEAQGGTLAAFEAHEEGKASYRAELANLASSGADTLAIFDYGDGSGLTILREALENGFFEKFVGGDGMKSNAPIEALGAENLTNFVSSSPVGSASEGLEAFNAAFTAVGGDKDAIFVTTSYDAAFLLALAIEKAGGDKSKVSAALREVASAPGEPILPGEWAKAKAAIAAGQDIDYKGAAGDQEFDANGDVPGAYALFAVKDGALVAIADMK